MAVNNMCEKDEDPWDRLSRISSQPTGMGLPRMTAQTSLNMAVREALSHRTYIGHAGESIEEAVDNMFKLFSKDNDPDGYLFSVSTNFNGEEIYVTRSRSRKQILRHFHKNPELSIGEYDRWAMGSPRSLQIDCSYCPTMKLSDDALCVSICRIAGVTKVEAHHTEGPDFKRYFVTMREETDAQKVAEAAAAIFVQAIGIEGLPVDIHLLTQEKRDAYVQKHRIKTT